MNTMEETVDQTDGLLRVAGNSLLAVADHLYLRQALGHLGRPVRSLYQAPHLVYIYTYIYIYIIYLYIYIYIYI